MAPSRWRRCRLNDRFITLFATGFGAGYAPLASGTVGSLIGIPLYLVFSAMPWPLWLTSIVALTCLGCYVADEAERLFGRKDDRRIVIDEIVGMQWSLFLIAPVALHLLWGFLLFRLCDVVKPFPARYFQDRLPGGLGVVADDWAAGIYANAALQLLIRFT